MNESIVVNCDCMEYMRTVPDKAFDLAVVDPPYGIGIDRHKENRKIKVIGGGWTTLRRQEESNRTVPRKAILRSKILSGVRRQLPAERRVF